jgi:hypothetical protein
MHRIAPRVINQDHSCVDALHPISIDAGQFSENWLQEVLFDHPELLPLSEIDPRVGKAVPLAREFSVTAGSVDLIYATAEGTLCLVETKLWRNPEAHRTVLAQLLDYAKDLARMDYAEFEGKVKTAARRNGQSKGLDDIMKSAIGRGEFDCIRFEQGLRRSLATGNFLLLIVGDRIRPEVVMLSDMIGTTPNLEFTLALVEIAFYHLTSEDKWPILAVPSVVGRSYEVTRAVVKIRYEARQPEVEVTVADERTEQRGHIDMETFLSSLSRGLDEVFRPYLERWMADNRLTVYWGKAGFSLRFVPHQALVTVIDAYPTSFAVIKEELAAKWQQPLAYQKYRDALQGIAEVRRLYGKKGRYVYYDKLAVDEVRLILEVTDTFVQALIANPRAVTEL